MELRREIWSAVKRGNIAVLASLLNGKVDPAVFRYEEKVRKMSISDLGDVVMWCVANMGKGNRKVAGYRDFSVRWQKSMKNVSLGPLSLIMSSDVQFSLFIDDCEVF